MMMLLDVLGKIAWVRKDFLSQGKISVILIWCARNTGYSCSENCQHSLSHSPLHQSFSLSYDLIELKGVNNKTPEYPKMQFHMMTLFGVLGKIAWVR